MRIPLIVAALFFTTVVHATSLTTVAETSGWTKTGRYEEVILLCHAFEKSYPGRVRCEKFGTTPEGREMFALIANESRALSPAAAARKKLPVVLAQGAIHAGECDGKDAGLYLLRELLEHRVLPGVLKKVVFVFVPVFNVDGHERFGAHNRPNQRGPEEMGWRVTAHNLNLNRDYVKAEAPEMQAMLKLLNAWDPILYTDLHVTDGAEFQHDIAVMVDPRLAGPAELRADALALSAGLMTRLKELKHLPLPFYPDFRTDDDPSSGFEAGISSPRFSDAYWGDRNRIGVLVETHSWKDYATRVHATIDTLAYLLESAARDGTHWIASAHAADQRASQVAGQPVALSYETNGKSHPIEFLGYEYKRDKSDVSGALMTVYDPTRPKTFTLPFFDEVQPKLTIRAPAQGYYVPAIDASWVEAKLKLQGIAYKKLGQAQSLDVEVFRCLSRCSPRRASKEGISLKSKASGPRSTTRLRPGRFLSRSPSRARGWSCRFSSRRRRTRW